MSRTLIVSDNEILNQLYITNLEVYLNTQTLLVDSTQKAQDKIQSDKFDLIVTMNMMEGQDSAYQLFNFLKSKDKAIPLVVIGNPSQDLPEVTVVQSSYNLQNLLRACAKILGVTAKSMAALEVPDYFPVNLKILSRINEAPCPLYLQVKKGDDFSFVMVAKTNGQIATILKKFEQEKIETLYVSRLDRLLIVNKISTALCDFIKSTEKLDISQKNSALEQGFDFVVREFSEHPQATAEIFNIANACTKVMQEMTKEAPGLRSLLNILESNKNGYIYSHSMLAAYVASHIIKKVSWGGESHVEKINFVLFFHDIMLAPIYQKHPELKYEEDLLFNDALNEKEKEMVLNHARMAAETIISFRRAPMGADLLIKQHHGMTNGMGFAIDFKDDISPVAKIVLIAEAFIEEYMKGKDADPKRSLDTKKIISVLQERFKRSTYRKIIETLETIVL